jgi:dethiobiotin synthetase
MGTPGAQNIRNNLNPAQLTLSLKNNLDTETIVIAMKGYFITGTDTGVGKTLVSLALMHALQAQGKNVAGMKPVSAGCLKTKNGLRNDDAVQLQKASSIELPYDIINPYAYEPPIAPHIAAHQLGDQISINKIEDCFNPIASQSDLVIVEGAGGWLVPINENETMADIAVRLNLPVVLVVGMRLGCLNHALLTVESIQNNGGKLAGWVANQIPPNMDKSAENIDSLEHRISAPLLGLIPCNPDSSPAQISPHLDISLLNK